MVKSLCNITFFVSYIISEEFVTKYLETRTRLSERINEVYKKIADHKR